MLFEDLSQSAKLRALKQIPNGHTTSDYRFTEDILYFAEKLKKTM